MDFLSRSIRRYFASGWAFLLPYLAAYLLYVWRDWPTNPKPESGAGLSEAGVPPLLHIYWALHGMHALLGSLALHAWWHGRLASSDPGVPACAAPKGSANTIAVLPWALLALLFYLPGTYLEFPSDPWEHLRRINEWSTLGIVHSAATWTKSGYFLAYSLIGRVPGDSQLPWLDVYCTGACLLLCWQYFRLGRSVGLGRGAAFAFVVLQALALGNSAFSFYRYYALASTIFSQIALVALIRTGVETASQPHPLQNFRRRACPICGSALGLLVLIAFGHLQGLGMAALGVTAAVVWRLLEWRRSMIWWLGAVAVVLSVVAVHFLPRDPAIDQSYRASGVLTSWYGFNLFSPGSMPWDRMLQILGLPGAVNVGAALLLLRRNHVAAWLTVLPLLALCLPVAAIPLADALASSGDWDSIIVFHRMLLAIPAGLALVCLFRTMGGAPFLGARWPTHGHAALAGALLGLFALTTLPPGAPFFNRFWHAVARPPDDLEMKPVWTALQSNASWGPGAKRPLFAAAAGVSFVAGTQRPGTRLVNTNRRSNGEFPPARSTARIRNGLSSAASKPDILVVLVRPSAFYTAASFAALSSNHWLPQEAAWSDSATRELKDLSEGSGLRNLGGSDSLMFYRLQRR